MNNLTELISLIETRKKTNVNRNFKIIKALFDFNIDFKKDKVIHIAGTNGKGSTALYLKNLIKENNLKVGLFQSPYFYKFNERIMINDNLISDEELIKYINILLDYENKNNVLFSFFEFIFLVSLIYFKTCKIDYLILEAGIGGSFDVTNLINSKYQTITSISMDHTEILGKNKKQIFLNKLGILKTDSFFITSFKKYHKIIKKRISNINGNFEFINLKKVKIIKKFPFHYQYENLILKTNSFAKYEINNSLLAVKIYEKLNLNFDNNFINNALLKTALPGRFEKEKNFILDGAHNLDALKKTVKNFKIIYPESKIIIFSCLNTRPILKHYQLIKKHFNEIYFVLFNDPKMFKKEKLFFIKKNNILDNNEKIKELICRFKKDSNKTILVTGSIHLLSIIKPLI